MSKPKSKLNQNLNAEQRVESLYQLLVENQNPNENKYVVEIVANGLHYMSYFSDANSDLDALCRALLDFLAWHSQVGITDVAVFGYCEDCKDQLPQGLHTNIRLVTMRIPQ